MIPSSAHDQRIKSIAIAALVLFGGMVAPLAAGDTRKCAPTALLNGSRFTLGLLAAVGAFMALSWSEFFTTFHRIFFEGETWTYARLSSNVSSASHPALAAPIVTK